MMGRRGGDQASLFYQFHLDERVPKDHLLRRIDGFVMMALADMHERLKPLSLLKIQFGAIEDRDKQRGASPILTRLDVRSDDAGRQPPGRQLCCCLYRVAAQGEAVDSPC